MPPEHSLIKDKKIPQGNILMPPNISWTLTFLKFKNLRIRNIHYKSHYTLFLLAQGTSRGPAVKIFLTTIEQLKNFRVFRGTQY